ncbi:MAG TPA: TIGR01906 family membrane protein [Anaerolineae bacterium]|nr:TIGR01906 family membrane protein [Anaerolineae bacterium]
MNETKRSRRSIWVILAGALLAILVPVVLLLTSLRLLLTDAFIHIEYRLPGFPEDSYGFTLEDRLRWAPLALDYLLNDEGIEFLADLEFDDGSPLYNQRELKHMQDVKILTQWVLDVWIAGMLAVILVGVMLYFRGHGEHLWSSIRLGTRIMLLLMLALVIGLAIAFPFVFVGFHRIFFEGDTWLFEYSNTLIRLFPERFWRDAFVFVVVLTVGGAGLTHWIASRRLRRSKASET